MDARIIDMQSTDEQKTSKVENVENVENILPTPEQSREIIKNLIEDLDIDESLTNGEDAAGIGMLFSILELPDQEFYMMSGIILDTLEKSLNNPNDRIMMSQALNLTGVTGEELAAQYQEIIDEIDKNEEIKKKYDQKRIDYIKSIFVLLMNAVQDTLGGYKRAIGIGIQLIHPDAKLPEYARVGDAGMDVYALDDYEIKPGETKIIPTGIKVAIPRGYELQVRPKSGRAAKTKLRVANAPGTIDSGYRAEVGVIIENIEPPIKDITYEFDDNGRPIITSILHGESFTIGKGEKFAQLVLNEVPSVNWEQVEDISIYEGDRGGGFGSTGLKADGKN